MNTFEGVCTFCGETEILMAESQEDADRIVTEKCSCGGYSMRERADLLLEYIDDITKENPEKNFKAMEDAQVMGIKDAAIYVFYGHFDEVKISVAGSAVTIKATINKNVEPGARITRKAVSEEEAEV